MTNKSECIRLGHYIVIQRQNYTKLHKFSNSESRATLGNDQIELANAEGCKYHTTFKIIPKRKEKQRICSIEVANDRTEDLSILKIRASGNDNRDILDDGKSQKLTKEEITSLRENMSSSNDILDTLITNSNTFHSKTEYSQEKYLKKKQKKYFEYLTIKKPTLRLIADILYRQDPAKILGIKADTLSQLLAYSNVNGDTDCLLYDSGTSGLLVAGVLHSLGANTNSRVVHIHPGNSAQKQALLAMNFSSEQTERCISVNIYSFLRHFYQQNIYVKDSDTVSDIDKNSRKRKISECAEIAEDSNKKIHLKDVVSQEENNKNSTIKPMSWELDNERACQILRKKADCLIIASKEHPLNIFIALLPFLKISRPFVIYNQFQEPIKDCYLSMRKLANVTCLKMTSSWIRDYQVLPNRTHPDVLMQNSNGYLLSGWIVE